MVVINPEECIDCGVCEPECPIEAIQRDIEPGLEKWVELNRTMSREWPKISVSDLPLPDADQWKDVPNKFEKFFSANPGKKKS
jgi:ferredoxin